MAVDVICHMSEMYNLEKYSKYRLGFIKFFILNYNKLSSNLGIVRY